MAFADTNDVATRLVKTLSVAEQAQAEDLLAFATAVICEAVGKTDEDWFGDIADAKQDLIRGFTVSLVCRSMPSPQGLESATESLGAHSRSETYRRGADSPIVLTPIEGQVIRSFVYGNGVGSSDVESFFDRRIDLAEGRDVDEDP